MKIRKILVDVAPKYMRKYFIEKWDNTYPEEKWKSGISSGESLVNKIADEVKSKEHEEIIGKLKFGNEKNWDLATLAFALLNSNLKLIARQISTQISAEEEIKCLIDIESVTANIPSMTYPLREYDSKIKEIKRIAMNIFGTKSLLEIDDIDNSPLERKMKIKERQLREKEKSRKGGSGQASEDLTGEALKILLADCSLHYAY